MEWYAIKVAGIVFGDSYIVDQEKYGPSVSINPGTFTWYGSKDFAIRRIQVLKENRDFKDRDLSVVTFIF